MVESFSSVTTETPNKQQYAEMKEAIRNITLIDDFENETKGKNQTSCPGLYLYIY